jgi:5-methylcytosine-specific restriction enzyme B
MINIATQERINSRINDDLIQEIIAETDFHFELGTKAIEDWQTTKYESPDFFEDLSKLDYTAIKEKALTSSEVLNALNLMNTIVSYCDENANEKNKYNQYPDNRVVAKAGIRQNHWIKHLLIYKLDQTSPAQSIKNALNYLLDPLNNVPIISEDHKRLISEQVIGKPYNFDTFTSDLIECFKPFNLNPNSDKNLTYIIMRLLYFIDDVWCDTVTGLIARDTDTSWKAELIQGMSDSKYGTIWWHKRPSHPTEVLDSLKKKIKDESYFYFYYVASNNATYRARVVDFVEKSNYNSKVDEWAELKPYWFNRKVEDYKSDDQSASIVFLLDQFEKLEKSIPIDDFAMYKNAAKPNVVNLVAYSRIKDEILQNIIPTNLDDNKKSNSQVMKQPLNQILYGPPGTGKTYNTINKAIKIIDSDFDLSQTRENVKQRYEELVKSGQIVFTTFHQSMCYEDFIEGIKPVEPKTESTPLSYKVQNGIFKEIAKKAKENSELSSIKDSPKQKKLFDSVFNILIQKVESALLDDPISVENNMQRGLVIKLASSFFCITGINGSSIRMMTRTGNEQNTMTKSTLQTIYEDSDNLDKYIVGGMKTYYRALVDEMIKWEADVEVISKDVEARNYVLIIDEINRGNVSQIFGELITLIEEDKRLGKEETLEVTLPYSKEKFGVPTNLYIIGTMNTADRSVEALDAALRRRFSFEEMSPKPDLIKTDGKAKDGMIDGIDLVNLMTTINKRIEVLLDKDHQIGHSYFMCVRNVGELKLTIQNKIIPLLQEYFFGDYGKIGLVLGNGFVKTTSKQNKEKLFADFSEYDASDFSERVIYKIENVANMENSVFHAAIKTLLNN